LLVQPKINGSALGVIADPGEIGTASAGTAFLGLCEYENLLTKTIILICFNFGLVIAISVRHLLPHLAFSQS
jgi:hypothetical protein